jgi:hypothetical protein
VVLSIQLGRFRFDQLVVGSRFHKSLYQTIGVRSMAQIRTVDVE